MTRSDKGRIHQTLNRFGDDGLCLSLVIPTLALRIHPVNTPPLNRTRTCLRRRECDQVTVVITMIGERDQALVTATVMPTEAVTWNTCTQAFVEDAFHIFCRVILRSGCGTIEEVGRRHLPRVARNHHLLTSGNRANCIPRCY